MEDLSGRVVVITGAASGIGKAMAQGFAKQGALLALADVEEGPLEVIARKLGKQTDVLSQVVDVSDGAQVDALAAATVERFGRYDVVCNNAGVSIGGTVWEFSQRDWDWILGVNLGGVVNGIRSFVPGLVTQGSGHVVNTASIAGLFPAPFLGPYNAAKHAVVAISETLSVELAMAGVDVGVTVACPGWVRTRIFEAARNRPTAGTEPASPAGGPTAAVASEVAQAVEAVMAQAISPREVADAIIGAVRANTFCVLTHEHHPDAIRRRVERLLSGAQPDPSEVP